MNQKQNRLRNMAHGNGLQKGLAMFSDKNRAWMALAASMVLMLLLTPLVFAEEDTIYEKCMSQTDRPAPWCYQEEVEKTGDPSLCENILKYWPNAIGVHGWCYYRLAILQKDCELCNPIKAQDIKKTCKLDACK